MPGLSRDAAARLRLIMRGTAATLAAGGLFVVFWWMAAIVPREHGTHAADT